MRLRSNEDFARLFRTGEPVFFQEGACYVGRNEGSCSRIGVAFKREAFPLAIKRHLYKRRLTTAIQEEAAYLPKNKDLLIFFRKRLHSESHPSFKQLVQKLLSHPSIQTKSV
jgi:ribonuclease P protein component